MLSNYVQLVPPVIVYLSQMITIATPVGSNEWLNKPNEHNTQIYYWYN